MATCVRGRSSLGARAREVSLVALLLILFAALVVASVAGYRGLLDHVTISPRFGVVFFEFTDSVGFYPRPFPGEHPFTDPVTPGNPFDPANPAIASAPDERRPVTGSDVPLAHHLGESGPADDLTDADSGFSRQIITPRSKCSATVSERMGTWPGHPGAGLAINQVKAQAVAEGAVAGGQLGRGEQGREGGYEEYGQSFGAIRGLLVH